MYIETAGGNKMSLLGVVIYVTAKNRLE